MALAEVNEDLEKLMGKRSSKEYRVSATLVPDDDGNLGCIMYEVFDENNRPVACLDLDEDTDVIRTGEYTQAVELEVKEGHRREGLGQALLNRVKEDFTNFPSKKGVILEAEGFGEGKLTPEDLKAFYLGAGFKEIANCIFLYEQGESNDNVS
jgi:GNAT superfamily N-acetyltransferase